MMHDYFSISSFFDYRGSGKAEDLGDICWAKRDMVGKKGEYAACAFKNLVNIFKYLIILNYNK